MAYKCKICGQVVDTAEHCGQPCDEVAEEQKEEAQEKQATK